MSHILIHHICHPMNMRQSKIKFATQVPPAMLHLPHHLNEVVSGEGGVSWVGRQHEEDMMHGRRKMFLMRGAGLLNVLREVQMCGQSPNLLGESGGMPPGNF